MSFVNAQNDAASRAKTVILVGGIHALIATGLIAGLTVSYFDPPFQRDPILEFPTDPVPPPPPEDQVQPPETVSYAPPVAPRPKLDVFPEPKITVDPVGPVVRDMPVQLVPGPINLPTTAPLDPSPIPSFTPSRPSPRNGPAGWISNNDYPSTPLRRGDEGSADYRLIVGSDGRVDACEITVSSGSSALDRATCRLIERRARFDPATDSSGEIVVGTYRGSVTWQIPD